MRRRRRPVLPALLALGLLLAIQGCSASSNDADHTTAVTIVGTSDVFDSSLFQSVLKPGFEAAYPQYTASYVPMGTGKAIAYAEAGTASALIVHAASLENQFVGDGYSLEPYGRAVFWGDFVLLGPTDDPAGVMSGDSPSTSIVAAFQKVASAGAAGKAEFVSRNDGSGTNVQEHAIWADTAGVSACSVSTDDGGGTVPSTTKGSCPDAPSFPSWYHATGASSQSANVQIADACNFGAASNDCYVFTDRGTYQYLASQQAATDLRIVTKADAEGDPAAAELLVNSFHAYAVDPARFADDPNVRIDTAGATAFLDWLTSPAGQSAVGRYLAADGDPPFIPDAAPSISLTSTLPAQSRAGQPITVSGSIANVVPGTPALAGRTVELLASTKAQLTPRRVATATTGADGAFTLTYRPTSTAAYTLRSLPITQVENASLTPRFGDLLQPGTKRLGTVRIGRSRDRR